MTGCRHHGDGKNGRDGQDAGRSRLGHDLAAAGVDQRFRVDKNALDSDEVVAAAVADESEKLAGGGRVLPGNPARSR